MLLLLVPNYSLTDIIQGGIRARHEHAAFKSTGAGRPCADLRASDASVRNGIDSQAPAKAREHQAALRHALYGDRVVDGPRPDPRQGNLARRQAARADRLCPDRRGARSAARLDA